jgi:GTPase involved in cell partitioning and DNA repair
MVPRFVYQFLKDKDTMLLCEGGRGGVAPLTFKKGDGRKGANGEKKSIDLELRLVNDCCLIGAPNSGKTSILSNISSIYEINKDEDGFLYVCCSEENTFG